MGSNEHAKEATPSLPADIETDSSAHQDDTRLSFQDDDTTTLLPPSPTLAPTDTHAIPRSTRIRGASLQAKVIWLTLCLAGLQFTWSVEMAYGTPYLLSLGLSKSHMSLVWIAGPLSGLIMQPVVGAFSDKCTSKWGRRRPFMVGGSVLVVLALLIIGWTKELTGVFVDAEKDAHVFKVLSIVIAIFSIYLLDFSINCVQASCRALIVDALSPSQQELGTAWAGRMIGLGNVVGYFMGYADLANVFPFFGDTQLKVLCFFASLILLVCDAITCYAVQEMPLAKHIHSDTHSLKTMKDIFTNIWHLPRPIQQVCNVQFFSWIGWFPFLFYSTTWVAEIYTKTMPLDGHDIVGQATRAGSFSFLVYSLVSLAASFILPLLVRPSGEASMMIVGSDMGVQRTSTPAYQCLTLPRLWTISHFLFCIAMLCTWFVGDIAAASVVIGICGISWATIMWAPFSLIGEAITRLEQEQAQQQPHHPRQLSTEHLFQHHQARLSKLSLERLPSYLPEPTAHVSAGIFLGIHNMYIVLPQFLVTFLSSILFRVLENDMDVDDNVNTGASSDAIGVVLRFGAIMAAVAGFISLGIK
ncbi:MFS general substrate transporter [Hesseltinella vesiculosa]|uniref:MFS general substrate transporter n=1 Tax=Hesseltinella vesiculosa TaxID=101127 RepID=A0A1X2GP94_9FUNG|nr:MFS general substrate transporter [Hesseltinella vesiculosa]